MMLEVEGLEVWHGPVPAVHGLAFRVDRGESLALIGPNGAGKTSALEAIAGLVPSRQGAVRLDGESLEGRSAAWIARRGLALVPQWRELFPELSVEETLLAATNAARGRDPLPLGEVYELFPPLAQRRRQAAGTLSGGEQQMLAIARALVTAPKAILLDEPSAGLAAVVLRAMLGVLTEIRTRGVSLVVVEQDLELATALAPRCVVLAAGRAVWEGPIDVADKLTEVRRAYFA